MFVMFVSQFASSGDYTFWRVFEVEDVGACLISLTAGALKELCHFSALHSQEAQFGGAVWRHTRHFTSSAESQSN